MRRVARSLLVMAVAAGGGACESRRTPVGVEPPHRATLTIRALTFDGQSAPRIFARARSEGQLIDSTQTADGSARLMVERDESYEISVGPTQATHYYTSTKLVRARGDTTLDVVIIPRAWRVRSGAHASVERPIDLAEWFAVNPDGTRLVNGASPLPGILSAWAPSAFPIAVGFDTTSVRQWTDADSLLFWSVVKDLEATVGRQLFRPAKRGAFAPPGGIGIRFDPSDLPFRGLLQPDFTRCSLDRSVCTEVAGEIMFNASLFFQGQVFFREETIAARRRTFAHELFHSLGVGHSCRRQSIMMLTVAGCVAAPLVPILPTEDDVALIEALTELTRVLVAHPTAWHLAEAAGIGQ